MVSRLVPLLKNGHKTVIEGFVGASLARELAPILFEAKRPLIWACTDRKKAEIAADQLRFFAPKAKILVLPAFDAKPYFGLSPHTDTRLCALKALHGLTSDSLDAIIAPASTLFRRVMPRGLFLALAFKLAKNDLIERADLIQKLQTLGYQRSPVVEDAGQYAVRGDIIDIFPPQLEQPIRLTLFDIEVESIKDFDPITQRTAGERLECEFPPAREFLLELTKHAPEAAKAFLRPHWPSDLKKRADARDIPKLKRDQTIDQMLNGLHFPGSDYFLPLLYAQTDALLDYASVRTVLINDTGAPLPAQAQTFIKELAADRSRSEHLETIFSPEELYLDSVAFDQSAGRLAQITHGRQPALGAEPQQEPELIASVESNLAIKTRLSAQITNVHSLAPLASELNQKRVEGTSCRIICQNDVQLERMRDLLSRFELPLTTSKQITGEERLVTLIIGLIHEGFLCRDTNQWWLTDEEIFGRKTRRAPGRTAKTTVFSSFAELTEGDSVIHMDHGIGLYRGLTKLAYDPNQNDFLLIEYLGGDKLYVPVDKLSRVQRYASPEGLMPQLDKLGGQTWGKTRDKAKRAARKLAGELLEIQAKRATLPGSPIADNLELVETFDAAFEFEETPDQMAAIEDVSSDLGKARPMDRLVCGDVGYGKTEVAMRAAFRVASDGKQIAVLVPTTVLAFQHYQTFKTRFAGHPINIELLSRFRSEKEQADSIKKLKEGGIDIIIGTHRLLSKDIRFRDLGLLIVDEEHRFGVTHKERIKKLKTHVHVLTLTATPIPRTLNFALNGIRDLSLITTPPTDRLAVRTFPCAFDETTIREAILKELQRGGQVFFVHNRVQSIEKMAKLVTTLVPEARVRVAHGQMGEEGLEDAMIGFMNCDFDVLICTTIVESGIDIPNANTMIINRADTFGLAQLYQLRGRIGRSHHRAYCYLIVPADDLITERARKRLNVIQRFTELGAGFKVATHDLEIRGAGNILGDEQSGHVAAVGYDLYAQMLEAAIADLKQEMPVEDFEPDINLILPAKIPDAFVADASLRLTLYKQVSSAQTLNELSEIREEWQDRFGILPSEVENLFKLIGLHVRCKKLLISGLKQKGHQIALSFHPEHRIDTALLTEAISRNPKKFSLARDGSFVITQVFDSPDQLLIYLGELLDKLAIDSP
jgi:transcription-repair coupling factor (superfamily II helicase)